MSDNAGRLENPPKPCCMGPCECWLVRRSVGTLLLDTQCGEASIRNGPATTRQRLWKVLGVETEIRRDGDDLGRGWNPLCRRPRGDVSTSPAIPFGMRHSQQLLSERVPTRQFVLTMFYRPHAAAHHHTPFSEVYRKVGKTGVATSAVKKKTFHPPYVTRPVGATPSIHKRVDRGRCSPHTHRVQPDRPRLWQHRATNPARFST
jgi:hypothetical protein